VFSQEPSSATTTGFRAKSGGKPVEPVTCPDGLWRSVFLFETLIGRRLPHIRPILACGPGVVCLASAIVAIREQRLHARIRERAEPIDRS
jgi:hypothetical protein